MLRLLIIAGLFPLLGAGVQAQEQERPFVKGGMGDKPFITRAGRTSIGGYAEVHFRYEREDGVAEELSFVPERFNLFTYTPVSERVRVASELEFEEGGEEIKIEIAAIDFEIHPALTFRGGILLSPLGRFNLAHDSPANDLTDRPLVSTELLGTTLSEAGMGFYGAFFPTARSRLTYEFYGVNGLGEGVLIGDPAGVRVQAGRGNFEDQNRQPSWVGRIGLSPFPAFELGVSGHTGPYNIWEADGLPIDQRRDLTLWAVDWEGSWRRCELLGEYGRVELEIPPGNPLYAESQQGFYLQLNAHWGRHLLPALPAAVWTGVMRWERVDFNADRPGDSQRRLTLGINLRPEEQTVFKLDYQRNWARDPFENQSRGAALLFSAATYF
ncbi:MAG: hypothetical protein FJY95_00450 [Candidatus Handelsmanbacteria bacterium]|nr:hypothetical protein [Candidatus Handelsmanbacteria bacterium]